MGINSLMEDAIGLAKDNPIATAVGVGAVGAGAGLAVGALLGSSTKRKTRKTRSKSGRARDRLYKSKQKHERNYKRKRRYKVYGKKGYINPRKSSKRRGKVYYARKTGQPYIILASGKAKFIKGKRRK